MPTHARSGLLTGCALAALLIGLPQAAGAQSFQGSYNVVTGSAGVVHNTGTTEITVGTAETVINWTAEDTFGNGNIDFQPAGTTATFRTDGLSDFTVLNRILPVNGNGIPVASTVSFNGTVESFTSPVGNPNVVGGQIWFYSPTGIIAGPTAIFNVGSLILTTNDIQFVADDFSNNVTGSIYGPGGLVEFRGPADSAGRVEIQNGAQINALGNPSGSSAYVALVAPRVVQSGQVSADGNIAYIAAEQVDMTINAGLVDFTLTVGTTDSNGVVHDGTTTGPVSTGAADLQRISMLALPKNDALTMLLSGSIGYAPAANAFNDGSSVVLAAGFADDHPSALPDNRLGSLDIGATTFANSVTGYATDGIQVAPSSGATNFQADANLQAARSIDITAGDLQQVTVGGNLYLSAGEAGTGGAISLLASGGAQAGLIDVAGTMSAYASSDGILAGLGSTLDGHGGSVDIAANGGRIEAATLFASADGYGSFDIDAGGDGTGGAVSVRVQGGGTIAADFVSFSADGSGGGSDNDGGDGFGGSVSVVEQGGALAFRDLYITARAYGAYAFNGGDATGGTARVEITSQAQTWDYLSINTSGTAGSQAFFDTGLTGNVLSGGQASLTVSGTGSLDVAYDVFVTANSYMGLEGPAAFSGQAGGVDVSVSGGASLVVGGALDLQASALFFEESLDPDPATAPTQHGGTVSLTADGGSIIAGYLYARAEAVGMSAASTAGTATGGTVTVSALGGGSILLDDDTNSSFARISADAFGALGPAPADAIGGTARIVLEDGSFTVLGDIDLSANARMTDVFYDVIPPGDGFDATGGTASVQLLPGALGTANLRATSLSIQARGDGRLVMSGGSTLPGGDPFEGNGGDGTGGQASLSQAGGALVTGSLTLDASGLGGGSGIGDGGMGTGGTAEVGIADSSVSLGSVSVVALGTGGYGQVAGEASGGHARFAVIDTAAGPSGTRDLADLTLDVSATGGSGNSGTTALSNAGLAEFVFDMLDPGSSITLPGSLGVFARATNFTPSSGIRGVIAGAPLDLGGDLHLSTAGPIAITADQALNVGGSAFASGNSFTSSGLISAAVSMDIAGTIRIDAEELRSGGTTTLSASGGLLAVGELLSAGAVNALGRSVNITSSTGLQFGAVDATAGNATISTGGFLSIDDISATGTIALDADGAFSLSGSALGQVVRMISDDIFLVGSGAYIGERGLTQTVELINRDPSRTTFIGGGADDTGYSLDQAELAVLFADNLISLGVGSGATAGQGLIAVRDFAMSFGPAGNLGSGATLEISTPTEVMVTGNVALTTSSADDTFLIDPSFIGIDTTTGSIAMLSATGAPMGRLALVGDTVAVGTTAVLGQLRTASSIGAINALLDQPGGTSQPLRTGTMSVSVTDGFYVQNTGTSTGYDDRRGITANAIAISTSKPTTKIAINAQILSSNGPVTGLDVTPLVTINGVAAAAAGPFDPGSTINGCVIGTNCGFVPPEPPPSEELDPVDPVGPDNSSLVAPLIELAETRPLIEPPLVDEPITGVGNDDLWEPPCGTQDGNGVCRGGNE
ncbi:hypothetical protein KK137_11775 [Croceibacterium sp. LX-88]|uniref:Autotransporter domain-containing protein n=1 Tax=Croceibacterium selenioxidans TaxID=2838833 RepID=A0ABS5W5N9_9SPHN|nr:hypothetical protein [Croceibacterium selenioxidans]MBT2135014.1 hypothetical protein [Croceibacterium selenioxidans]